MLLALKYGNPAEDREMCKLAVMYADKAVRMSYLPGSPYILVVYAVGGLMEFDIALRNSFNEHA